MATSEELQELITCNVCLDIFTDPRMLPCQHTYCLQCLVNLQRTTGYITCPTCRLPCHHTANQLPKNISLTPIIDLATRKEKPKTNKTEDDKEGGKEMVTKECDVCSAVHEVSVCGHCDRLVSTKSPVFI